MSQISRKIIAALLALWLPLFSGSVLAASISMQFHAGQLNSEKIHSEQTVNDAYLDIAVPNAQQTIQHGDSCEQQSVGFSDTHTSSHDHHDNKCTACGICHLACSGYLAVSDLSGLTQQQLEAPEAIYLLSFNSITSPFLLPPPLALV